MWSLVKRENAGSLEMHDQISPEGHWLNKTGHVDYDSFFGEKFAIPRYTVQEEIKSRKFAYLSAGKSRRVAIWQKEIYC